MPIFSTGLPAADVRPDPLVSYSLSLPPPFPQIAALAASFFNKMTGLPSRASAVSKFTHINSSVQETMQSRSSLLFCFRSTSHVRLVPLPLPTPKRVFRLSSLRRCLPSLSFPLCRRSSVPLWAPRSLAQIRAASLSLVYYLEISHAETCNSGPYESAAATHVTSPRYQRILFVTRPLRILLRAAPAKISRLCTYVTVRFA